VQKVTLFFSEVGYSKNIHIQDAEREMIIVYN